MSSRISQRTFAEVRLGWIIHWAERLGQANVDLNSSCKSPFPCVMISWYVLQYSWELCDTSLGFKHMFESLVRCLLALNLLVMRSCSTWRSQKLKFMRTIFFCVAIAWNGNHTWKYVGLNDVCQWSLLRWNEKSTWTFIKAQTRIQNDLEQPNPNFPFSGLRLLEAVHVGWLELPSCQFYQLMKRISRFSDVSFMYLFRFRFWRCCMYFN